MNAERWNRSGKKVMNYRPDTQMWLPVRVCGWGFFPPFIMSSPSRPPSPHSIIYRQLFLQDQSIQSRMCNLTANSQKLLACLSNLDAEFNYKPWKWSLTCGISHSKSCRALDAKAKLVVVIVFKPATCRAPAPSTSWQQRELNSFNNSARWRHKLGAMTIRCVAQTQYSATIFSSSSTVLEENQLHYFFGKLQRKIK